MSGNSETHNDVSEPGLPALIKYLNHLWRLDKYNRRAECDVLDDPRVSLTTLAIPLDKAHELWDYGRTVVTLNDNDLKPAEPPSSWSVHSPVGLLRRGPLPADRLVRLADVVQWFITEQEKPRLSAVQRVCEVIDSDAPGWLYHVTEGIYAVPPDTGSGFIQFLPGTGTNAEKAAHSFVAQIQAAWGNAHVHGSVLEANEHPCAALACTINRAHALWGYGDPSIQTQVVDTTGTAPITWAELVSFRKHHAGSIWSVTQKRLIAAEKLRREAVPGANGIAKAMAAELGITVTCLNDQIRKANELGKREGRQIKAA